MRIGWTRYFRRAATGFLIVLLVGCAGGAGGGDPIIGTWEGTVDQPGFDPYAGVMVFTSLAAGKSTYPTSNCGGTLKGGGSYGAYSYRETITYGGVDDDENGEGCLDGRIQIFLDGDALTWDWVTYYEGRRIGATGKFTRRD